MKSREELVNRALEELGVIAAGQAAEPEDAILIDREIEPILSDLATRQVYHWGDPDNIDDDAFVHLAVLLANSRARSFGTVPDERVRLMAEGRLRQLELVTLSGQPQQVEYF